MKFALCITAVLASLALSSTAAAATTITKGFSFTLSAMDECGEGETITASGTAILIVTRQELDDGGSLLSTQLHTQGLSGASNSGIPYHGMALTKTTELSLPSGGGTETIVFRNRLIGTMGAPTFDVIEIAHTTVTPLGDVVVSFDEVRIECR
jgi:hypothetical protein